MQFDSSARLEWQRGWPVVLGVSLVSGFGVSLFYFTFNLLVPGMSGEFGASRGTMANIQALIIVGALAAPLIGGVLDRRGFRFVYALSAIAIIATYVALGLWATQAWMFAVATLVIGIAGIGCGPLAYTRPINAWFSANRGTALGAASVSITISTFFVAPALAALIQEQSWRAGLLALAGLFAFVALPFAILLVRNTPPESPSADQNGPAKAVPLVGDRRFLRDRDFRLMVVAIILIAVPGAGLVSSNSLVVQDEGFSPTAAAWGVSAYAVGQLIGRLVAGWFLDRAEPRRVAFFFTFVPAIGLIALAVFDLPYSFAILAIAMVGVQQGAEIDLFAYFVAKRFGLARYGSVYGWITSAGWVGNAIGIIAFGQVHDLTGSYAVIEAIGAALMMIGAVVIAMVRLTPDPEGRADQPNMKPG